MPHNFPHALNRTVCLRGPRRGDRPFNSLSFPLVLAAALAACTVPDAPAASPPAVAAVPVRIAPVLREQLARPVHAAGRVGYAAETRLSFKVGGVVARILVDDGARVRRGQLLARLDPREIDAQLSSAESARVKAERDLERARALRREDAVPGEVLENATTAAEVARANADAARFNRRFSEIRAPGDGVVLARLVETGEVVGPGTPILMVGAGDDKGRPERPTGGESLAAGRSAEPRRNRAIGRVGAARVVRIGVADRDVVRLAVGDAAELRLDALPGQILKGAVDEIAPAATPTTGAFEVTVRIDGAAATSLASGVVARVVVTPRAAEPVTTVPLSALVDADGARGRVFAVGADRKRVTPRAVDIAFLAGERVAIAGGLDGVAQVVSEGAAYLDEHSVIAVTP
jgi:multidrug efflux system membrane fusion protein